MRPVVNTSRSIKGGDCFTRQGSLIFSRRFSSLYFVNLFHEANKATRLLNTSLLYFSSFHEPEPLEANGIATRLQAGRYGFRISVRGKGIFSFPKRPDRLWGPPSFFLNGYRGSFPGVQPEGEADHPHPSGAEFRNEWSYSS